MNRPTLIIFGGLPATGKTSISREVARRTRAVHLRIDTIEQAIREQINAGRPNGPEGYVIAYGLARDNLALGNSVVADSVNPIAITRDAWLAVATDSDAAAIEIEVICSDLHEHRQRAETRSSDIAGLQLPTWEAITEREYEPWTGVDLTIDTAGRSVEACVADAVRLIESIQVRRE